MKFLDLSNWNDVQDFSQIKNDYIGAICKATEGADFVDKTFETKVLGLHSQGLKVGAYHFIRGNSLPSEQALLFYNTIKNIKLDFKPVIDIETTEFNGQAFDFIKQFAETFKQLSGLDCVIYSGWYYIRDNFTEEQRNKFEFWVADYGVESLPCIPNLRVVAWQYTNNEQVSGIVGCVDCSILYSETFFLQNYTVTQTQPQPNANDIINEYEEIGTATVIVPTLNVRDQPNTLTGSVLTTYNNGETFNYNHVIITNEYVWCRYKSYTGKIRFVAVKNRITGERYANCV